MVSILYIVSLWILRFDQILADVTIEAESINGDQIAGRDDTKIFILIYNYSSVGYHRFLIAYEHVMF